MLLDNIESLTKEDFEKEELYKELFEIKNEMDRSEFQFQLAEKARSFQVTDTFNKMTKLRETKRQLSKARVGELPERVKYRLDCKETKDKGGNIIASIPYKTIDNYEIILDHDYRFAGKIKFDEFSRSTCLKGSVPWEMKENYRSWSDYDDSALFACIQKDYLLSSKQYYLDSIRNVSMRNKFHPVRDVLNSLKWDGKEYIRYLLPDYLGVENTEYTYQVMRLWMLGAVARIYQPGCKFDYVMILQGGQGLGKSTLIRLMALDDSWFSDSLGNLDSEKAVESLIGTWVIELAELSSFTRTKSGTDSIKRFTSATEDRCRLPYAKRTENFPRQCVFAGTTNRTDFLIDETGNRRFYIIHAGVNKPTKSLFVPEVMDDIKAAWAEAVHIWKTERPKLILPDHCRAEAEQLQEQCMLEDGMKGAIIDYLEGKDRVCAWEIWEKALHEEGRPKRGNAGEINNIIAGLPGWKKIKNPTNFGEYKNQRGFEYQQKDFVDMKNASESDQETLPFD